MSTNVTPVTHFPKPGEELSPRIFSFKSLVETLNGLVEAPGFEQLNDWLDRVRVSADDLRPYRHFKQGTYARHRVYRNAFAELLVLCWRPGQRTPIHDHNGSYGALRV